MVSYRRISVYSGSTILALFALLIVLSGAKITSNGDIACFGTLEDPCINYINITTNVTTYIYNKGDLKLDFSPSVKDYTLCIKDRRYSSKLRLNRSKYPCGRYFKPIDFTEHPSKNRVYNFKFVKDRTYEFSLITYKNNISDEIKWTIFGAGGELDPKLLPVTTDDLFTELINNDAKKREATFELNNLKTTPLSKEDITLSFDERCGKVKGYKIYTDTICEKTVKEPIYNYKEICNIINGSNICYNETNTTYKIYNVSYDCKKEIQEIPPGKEDYDIEVDIQPDFEKCGGYQIDWKPELNINGKDYIKDEWAWFNVSFTYRRNISCTNMNDGVPIAINGTAGVTIDSTQQLIWTTCQGVGMALYYDDLTVYAVANDTEFIPFEVEFGNGTSVNPTSVWTGYKAVYHLPDVKDSTNVYNLTNNGANLSVTGIFDGAADFEDGETDYMTTGDIVVFTNGENYTWTAWHKPETVGGANRGIFTIGESGVVRLMYCYITTGSAFSCTLYNSAGGSAYITHSTTPVPGTWYYISFRFDNARTYLTIDNVTESIARNVATETATMPFDIGRWYGGAEYQDGITDEVRMKFQFISEAENNQTYQNYLNTAGFGNIDIEESQAVDNNTGPSVTLNAPANKTVVHSPTFNYTVVDANVGDTMTVELIIDGVVNITNTSIANNTDIINTVTGLSVGLHNWSVNVSDGSITNFSETRVVNITNIDPNVTLNYPPDEFDLHDNGTTIIFNYTAFDFDGDTTTVNITIDGVLEQTNTSIANNTHISYTKTGLTYGNHSWFVTIDDGISQAINSSTRTFNVSNDAPTVNLNAPTNGTTLFNKNWSLLNVTLVHNDTHFANVSFYQSNGSLLNTQINKSNGDFITYNWTGLIKKTQYFWFVNATDGISTTQSFTWNFITGYTDISDTYCSGQTDNYTFDFNLSLYNWSADTLTEYNVTLLNLSTCLFNLTNNATVKGDFCIYSNSTSTSHNLTCYGNNTVILNTTCQTLWTSVPVNTSRLTNCTMDYVNTNMSLDWWFKVDFNAT